MKKKPIRNELRAIISSGVAYLQLRQERREQFRRDAGVILAHESQERKNRRSRIKANREMAVADIIIKSGTMSDCCGSACLRNHSGDMICAECFSVCNAVEVLT